MSRIEPAHFDDGIRDAVQMLRKAGYKTFTSCEGGRGHAFRHPTVGVKVVGDYMSFRDKLAQFLKSQGCRTFEISLITCYHPSYQKPKEWVYVEGMDLLSPEKRKRALAALRRREQRLLREIEKLTGTTR